MKSSSIQTVRRIISELPTTRSSKKDQSDARETFIGISDAGLPFVRPSPRDSQAAVLGSPAVRSKKRVSRKQELSDDMQKSKEETHFLVSVESLVC